MACICQLIFFLSLSANLVPKVAGARDTQPANGDVPSGFDTMWAKYLESQPLDNLQRSSTFGSVCLPQLEGPADSSKLAILIHGFTSCPASMGWIAPAMVSEGFRVLRPLLPGHGRVWLDEPVEYCEIKAGDAKIEADCSNKNVTAHVTDNLAEMPLDKEPYLRFSEEIGALAEQFKMVHPSGTIVLVGHSLGGVISTKIALDHPSIFDRVLIMNPFYGPSSVAWEAMNALPKLTRVSNEIGKSEPQCEPRRGENNGGYCQFMLGNVVAMMDLATYVYCERWGISDCLVGEGVAGASAGAMAGVVMGHVAIPFPPLWPVSVPIGALIGSYSGYKIGQHIAINEDNVLTTQDAFRKLKSFQMIGTIGDPAVDSDRIEELVEKINQIRDAVPGLPRASLCWWPSVLTHNYFNPIDDPKRDYWWADYVRSTAVDYLANANKLAVVTHQDEKHDVCLPGGSSGVSGATLTILPAAQQELHYTLADQRGEIDQLDVVTQGQAMKQSEWFKSMRPRELEVLVARERKKLILVTRRHRDWNIRDLFIILPHAARDGKDCVTLALLKLDAEKPLLQQISEAEDTSSLQLRFCDAKVVTAMCGSGHLTCHGYGSADTIGA